MRSRVAIRIAPSVTPLVEALKVAVVEAQGTASRSKCGLERHRLKALADTLAAEARVQAQKELAPIGAVVQIHK